MSISMVEHPVRMYANKYNPVRDLKVVNYMYTILRITFSNSPYVHVRFFLDWDLVYGSRVKNECKLI